MKKLLIILALIAAIIVSYIIFKDHSIYYENISNFSIIYTSSQAFPGFSETQISIFSSGDYSYVEYSLGKPSIGENEQKDLVKSIGGKLNETELSEFVKFVIEENDFFSLPKDLDDSKVLDGSDSYIEVEYGERIFKVGGYGVNNKIFEKIVSRLYNYKFRFIG